MAGGITVVVQGLHGDEEGLKFSHGGHKACVSSHLCMGNSYTSPYCGTAQSSIIASLFISAMSYLIRPSVMKHYRVTTFQSGEFHAIHFNGHAQLFCVYNI